MLDELKNFIEEISVDVRDGFVVFDRNYVRVISGKIYALIQSLDTKFISLINEVSLYKDEVSRLIIVKDSLKEKVKGLTNEKAELSTKLNSMYSEIEVRDIKIIDLEKDRDGLQNTLISERQYSNNLENSLKAWQGKHSIKPHNDELTHKRLVETDTRLQTVIEINKELVSANWALVKMLEGHI